MNFNDLVDRTHTSAIKWSHEAFGIPKDVIPLWVADMDFLTPKPVIDALQERVKHGIFGYTRADDAYYDAVISWMNRRHNWQIHKEWIVVLPGVVPAINIAIQAFTKPNEAVMVQKPVYTPFFASIMNNQRKVVNSPLLLKGDKYYIDFADFEQKIIENQVKLFIMCSPHNPVGRVWKEQELRKIGEICVKHGVIMVVDEIHHDLILKPNKHFVFASLDEQFANIAITCTAPSKTFNLAGLYTANIMISNPDLRERFNQQVQAIGIKSANLLGYLGCRVAYECGDQWLDNLCDYLYENKQYIKTYIEKNMPKIKVIDSEATYLLWLDMRELGLSQEKLESFVLNEAKLWLNHGPSYGDEGLGFERLNMGCPRSLLEQAMNQLKLAYHKFGF